MKTLDTTEVISASDQTLLREVAAVIREGLPDAVILLYGSTARGTRESDSDYDLLVLINEPIPKPVEDRIEDAVYQIELEREAILSTFYYTWEQWNDPVRKVSPFHEAVEKDAVAL